MNKIMRLKEFRKLNETLKYLEKLSKIIKLKVTKWRVQLESVFKRFSRKKTFLEFKIVISYNQENTFDK